MSSYISHIDVHPDGADEQNLHSQGFKKINVNLNKGAEGKASYIWYKKGSDDAPITRIQLTFNIQMSVGLIIAGFKKIPIPISPEGADPIYMWFYRGCGEYDNPIVDLDFTSTAEEEAQKFLQGWEKLACDLNRRAGRGWLYLWMKREKPTYICDVTATDSFKSDEKYLRRGYIRVDEDVHRGAGREFIFIWYRQTTDQKRALSNLNISNTECEFQDLQEQNYLPVNLNFNELRGSHPMYLWYKKERCGKPIKVITLVLYPDLIPEYRKVGVIVLEKNFNAGTKGHVVYLCFYQ